jgi:hypothetical protein
MYRRFCGRGRPIEATAETGQELGLHACIENSLAPMHDPEILEPPSQMPHNATIQQLASKRRFNPIDFCGSPIRTVSQSLALVPELRLLELVRNNAFVLSRFVQVPQRGVENEKGSPQACSTKTGRASPF